jgi:hypothetical protein
MDMIPHEDIGVQMELIPIPVDGKRQDIFLIVNNVLEYPLPLVPADDDVIESAGVFDAGLAGHGGMIAKRAGNVKILILKSDPILLLIAASDDVVEGASELNAGLAKYSKSLAKEILPVNF